MLISVEHTPNPLTKKFSFGKVLTEVPFEFASSDNTVEALDPLFASGVSSVFVGRDYLALTVVKEAMWPDIQSKAKLAISNAAEAIVSLSAPQSAITSPADEQPIVSKIKQLLETHVRPAVAHDGGDVRFQSFDNGVLQLKMAGACAGCPSSSATLKMGILRLIQHFLPEVVDVRATAV